MNRIVLPALSAVIAAGIAAPAGAVTLVGLTGKGELISFDSHKPGLARTVAISGVQGTVLGIDVRPGDKKLYAVTDASIIYTVDPKTGAATQVAKLSEAFPGGGKAVVDFNPVADRLRLMGANGVNFRIHPDTGAVTKDGTLAYAANDRMNGKKPWIAAGAYTNSMAGAARTELFNLDTGNGVLTLQNPPNDGAQQTRGSFGVKFAQNTAFDIMPDGNGGNVAYALSGKTLYTVDLEKGEAKRVRELKKLPALVDIAIWPAS
jgi:Domain of unknown function (DUF4394)